MGATVTNEDDLPQRDRWARLRFAIIGWLVGVPALIALAQLMHAATFGSYHVAALGAIYQFFQGRNHARGHALYTGVGFGAGGALGGFISGYLWEAAGPAITFTVGAAAALAAWALVAARVQLDGSARG